MIGAVGDDDFGHRLKENLESVGVNIVGVETFSGEPTGQAYIQSTRKVRIPLFLLRNNKRNGNERDH